MTSHLIAFGYSKDSALIRLEKGKRKHRKPHTATPPRAISPPCKKQHSLETMRRHLAALNSNLPSLNGTSVASYARIRGLDAEQLKTHLFPDDSIWTPCLEDMYTSPKRPKEIARNVLTTTTPSRGQRLRPIDPKHRRSQSFVHNRPTTGSIPSPKSARSWCSNEENLGRDPRTPSSSNPPQPVNLASSQLSPAAEQRPSDLPLLRHYEGEGLRVKTYNRGLFNATHTPPSSDLQDDARAPTTKGSSRGRSPWQGSMLEGLANP